MGNLKSMLVINKNVTLTIALASIFLSKSLSVPFPILIFWVIMKKRKIL